MLILHLADVELKWSIIHSTPPFLECIVAYYATSLYKTGYGSILPVKAHNSRFIG
jgi:hypothetical protein